MTESELREQVARKIAEAFGPEYELANIAPRLADAVLPFIADAEASGRASATAEIVTALRARSHETASGIWGKSDVSNELSVFADRLTAGNSDE